MSDIDFDLSDPSTWTCNYCGHPGIRIEHRFKAVEHPYSIAGVAPKFAAAQHPWAICNGCGHESEGKR